MNNISNIRRCGFAAVFVFLLMQQASFAADTSITWQNSPTGLISDEVGSPLAAGSSNTIQFIYANGTYHSPAPGGSLLGGGDSLIDSGPYYIGEGGGGAGTFIKYLSPVTNPSNAYVRVWKGTPAQGNRYGKSPLRAVNVGPLDAPPTFSETFSTIYIANAPPVPTSPGVSNIGYDGATISWSLNSAYELTGEVLSYGTDAAATNLGEVAASGTSYTFPRLSLLPGQTYYVKIKALNYFGSGGWSSIVSFTTLGTSFGGTASGLTIQYSSNNVILTWEGTAATYEVWSADLNGEFSMIAETPLKVWSNAAFTTVTATTERNFQIRITNGQGAPETVGWYTFDLKKSASTGINSVSIPLDTTSGNSPQIFNASDVASSIGGNFEFIGGWDKDTQTEFAYLSNGTGIDFPITQGDGYQISVTANTSWTIVGEK